MIAPLCVTGFVLFRVYALGLAVVISSQIYPPQQQLAVTRTVTTSATDLARSFVLPQINVL
jgi:hypothetical protein